MRTCYAEFFVILTIHMESQLELGLTTFTNECVANVMTMTV